MADSLLQCVRQNRLSSNHATRPAYILAWQYGVPINLS